MKICAGCKETKELSAFPKNKNRKDGLHSYCKPCHNCKGAVSAKKNRPTRLMWERQYEALNKDKRKAQKALTEQKTHTKAYRKVWKQKNKDKMRSYCMNYHTAKLQRVPKWLSESQLNEIMQFYKDAEYLTHYTKTPFEVDHIVPLQGKLVSGLHVPWNLQILTESENCKKGNR